MPTFQDSDNIPQLLPEGDYIFCCTGFDIGISTGKKTSGAEAYDVELEIEPIGKKVTEFMVDHPSCAWKIDTFLKAAGVVLKKGEAFEFREDTAAQRGLRWVNPIGLRGWCKLRVEDYVKDGQKRQSNKIAVFYADKEKLPARVIEETPEEQKPF